jgi:hypothetical protein
MSVVVRGRVSSNSSDRVDTLRADVVQPIGPVSMRVKLAQVDV